LLVDLTLWRIFVVMSLCASPNNRKVMKAEHGRTIPRKPTANLELSITTT